MKCRVMPHLPPLMTQEPESRNNSLVITLTTYFPRLAYLSQQIPVVRAPPADLVLQGVHQKRGFAKYLIGLFAV